MSSVHGLNCSLCLRLHSFVQLDMNLFIATGKTTNEENLLMSVKTYLFILFIIVFIQKRKGWHSVYSRISPLEGNQECRG